MTPEAFAKFSARVPAQAGSGCQEWTGAVRHGIAAFCVGDRAYKPAHELAYEHHIGPVPERMTPRRSCDNAICVNPMHVVLWPTGRFSRRQWKRRHDEPKAASLRCLQVVLAGTMFRSRLRAALTMRTALCALPAGDVVGGELLAMVLSAMEQHPTAKGILTSGIERIETDDVKGTGRKAGNSVVVHRADGTSVLLAIVRVIRLQNNVERSSSVASSGLGREARERIVRCEDCGSREWETVLQAHRAECKGMAYDYMARRHTEAAW